MCPKFSLRFMPQEGPCFMLSWLRRCLYPILIANASDLKRRLDVKGLELVKTTFLVSNCDGTSTVWCSPDCHDILSKSCPHGLTHILDRNIPPCAHMLLNLCQESLAVYKSIRKQGEPTAPLRPTFLSSLLTVLLTAGSSHLQSSPGGTGWPSVTLSSPSFSSSQSNFV